MKTRINVVVRVRPLLDNELGAGDSSTTICADESSNIIKINCDKTKPIKEFAFDKVIGPTRIQEDVYAQTNISGLVDKVVEGYHATIFAYGQTGAGKTFTMDGFHYSLDNKKRNKLCIDQREKENWGITPRAISYLFERIREDTERKNRKYTVYCSYLQIYNEKIYDLLNPAQFSQTDSAAPGLKLRYKAGNFTVDNLYTFECKSSKDVYDLFQFGLQNRAVAAHKLNHASSRSHSILCLTVESVDAINTDDYVMSKLQLVDLAGSERAGILSNNPKLAKECIEINKSLFTLRQVITTLTEAQLTGRSTYIPYRDSKLTSLLRQSIGGNSYSLMISCLSPNDKFLEENISTLNYSTKAAYIANQPVKNQDPNIRLIHKLKAQICELTNELQKANEHIQLLTKLANSIPKAEPGDSEAKKSAVTINNNYSSSVIALIGNEPEKKGAAINIFMGNPSKEQKEIEDNVMKKLDMDGIHGDKEKIMDRLLQSVNMVKDVLHTNLKLRQKILEMSQQIDQMNAELFHVQGENEELKEKMQILANVNQTNVDAPETQIPDFSVTTKSLLDQSGKLSMNTTGMCVTPHEKIAVATELYQLKKDKSLLEQRLQNLERENINIRAKNCNNVGLNGADVSGTDDFEPVRSVMNGGEFLKTNIPLYRVRRRPKYTRYKSREDKRERESLGNIPKTSYAAQRGLSSVPRGYQHLERISMSPTQRLQEKVVPRKYTGLDQKPPWCEPMERVERFTETFAPRANRNQTALKCYEDAGVDYEEFNDRGSFMGNDSSMSDYRSNKEITVPVKMEKTQYVKMYRPNGGRITSNRRATSRMFKTKTQGKHNPIYIDNL